MAEGHRQRLRDKFLKYGLDAFTDEEIIELLLALGTPRRDCKEPARAAFRRFGSLAKVLEADEKELKKIKGIGPNNLFALKFIHQVARRFLRERLKEREKISCASDVVDYLCHALSFKEREYFIALYLDAKNGIIDIEELFSGTADASPVYPREVLRQALLKNATGLIIVHNHPSGSLEPSKADQDITVSFLKACPLLGIRLLDHIIIAGPSSYFSFADSGLLSMLENQGQRNLSRENG